jgi:signal transduction histidine kinase
VGNPLGVVQGYLTMLESLNSSEQHLVIQKMQRELDRITSAIHSLLDVSRPITLERAPLEIAPWLAALCENLTKMARLTGVSLSLENSLPTGFTFSLDKERLTAVLENLIINAADAMNSNSADKERKIRITAALNDKNLKINIIDNGPGISQENREKVFEPFFSTKPANRGSGLGLYTAKQIIELHGGKISLTNEIDGGLNVAVLLAA